MTHENPFATADAPRAVARVRIVAASSRALAPCAATADIGLPNMRCRALREGGDP